MPTTPRHEAQSTPPSSRAPPRDPAPAMSHGDLPFIHIAPCSPRSGSQCVARLAAGSRAGARGDVGVLRASRSGGVVAFPFLPRFSPLSPVSSAYSHVFSPVIPRPAAGSSTHNATKQSAILSRRPNLSPQRQPMRCLPGSWTPRRGTGGQWSVRGMT